MSAKNIFEGFKTWRPSDWPGIIKKLVEKHNLGATAGYIEQDDYWYLGKKAEGRVKLCAVRALVVPGIDTSVKWKTYFVYFNGIEVEIVDDESELIEFRTVPGIGVRVLQLELTVAELLDEFVLPWVLRVDHTTMHLVRNRGGLKGPLTLRPVPWTQKGPDADSRLSFIDKTQLIAHPLSIEPWMNDYEIAPMTKPTALTRLSTDFDFGFGE